MMFDLFIPDQFNLVFFVPNPTFFMFYQFNLVFKMSAVTRVLTKKVLHR